MATLTLWRGIINIIEGVVDDDALTWCLASWDREAAYSSYGIAGVTAKNPELPLIMLYWSPGYPKLEAGSAVSAGKLEGAEEIAGMEMVLGPSAAFSIVFGDAATCFISAAASLMY